MSLYIMFFVFFILMIAFIVITAFFSKKNKTSNGIPSDGYTCKQFLTDRERKFFHQARKVIPENDFFMAQVRVVDVVAVSKKYCSNVSIKMSLFRRISQWHCDFVWLDSQLNIKAVIELDDTSHQRKDRVRRDVIFNKIMGQAGIRLLRVKSFNEFARQAKLV